MTEHDEYLAAQRQIIRLQALLEASRRLHATTDLDEVLETTLGIVVRELEVAGAYFTHFPQTCGQVPSDVMERAAVFEAAVNREREDVLEFSLYDKTGFLFTNLVVITGPARKLTLDEVDFLEGLSLQAAVAIENVRFHERTLLLAQIREEREKARELLLNILPAKVAEDLQEGRTVSTYFEDATICFADFVGFSQSTESMQAGRLVKELHNYFTAFDKVIARYKLEKLKTIGDCYMFAGGLPNADSGSAVTAALAAVELLEEVRRLSLRANSPGWRVRIGLHTGPVIAGVVGIRKFAFDIWGNSVNFASRMESSGVVGRINLSRQTFERIGDFFACEQRGKVNTKDNLEVEMFLIGGVDPRLIADRTALAFENQYRRRFGSDLPSFPDFLLCQNLSSETPVEC